MEAVRDNRTNSMVIHAGTTPSILVLNQPSFFGAIQRMMRSKAVIYGLRPKAAQRLSLVTQAQSHALIELPMEI